MRRINLVQNNACYHLEELAIIYINEDEVIACLLSRCCQWSCPKHLFLFYVADYTEDYNPS